METERVDDLLVQRGIAADRKEAAALVLSGIVFVDAQRIDKPGTSVPSSSRLRIKATRQKYVSRGGLKLEGALRHFRIDVRDKVCMDIGASTGGFTDCLLQQGARKVYALDAGRGQLHWKLRQDPRVVFHDSLNVRYLDASLVAEPVDLIVVDVSFISLRPILPALRPFHTAHILALVKPQFEARREEVAPGGLIKDPALQKEIVERVKCFAVREGFGILAETPAALSGQKGNQEYFLFMQPGVRS